jgi:hypothetical protein
MIRTKISLNEREYTLAKKEAKKWGISFTELVRRAIRNTCLRKGLHHVCATPGWWSPEIHIPATRSMKSSIDSLAPFFVARALPR